MSTTGVSNNQAATSATTTTTTTSTSSNQLGQNGFLQILVAEVKDQDPTSQQQDPTQYVSQLAQFTSLQQMTNLNTTMTFTGALNLIGNTVELSDTDSKGNNITGVVQSVSNNAGTVTLNVQVPGSTTTKSYNVSDVINVTPESLTTSGTTSSGSAASGSASSGSAASGSASSGSAASGSTSS
jgi:flagellar basal-body rod modification protein FlgD